jgi:hypothetical protein
MAHEGPLSIAPLRNVRAVGSALENAAARTAGLPGIVCLYGPSGWGKSTAAAAATAKLRGYYVSVQSVWNRKAFLEAVLKEMGIHAGPTMTAMAAQIAEQLVLSNRPLLIDEADVLADKEGGAGLLKDLYEASLGTLLLIGEERLPQKLLKWERLHGRVLEWLAVEPVCLADAEALAPIYGRGALVATDLLDLLVRKSKGSVRRVVVNLDRIGLEARRLGWKEPIDVARWGDRPIYTGEAPVGRVLPNGRAAA